MGLEEIFLELFGHGARNGTELENRCERNEGL
jgi:hypothetical protein